MRGKTKIEIVCAGELVNKYSDGGRHYGWSNPIESIPPIDSIIEYMTFNQNHKEGQGILTKYLVKGYVYTTEEDFNHAFRNQICKILVDVVS